jgi:hypothetical protein
MTEPTNTTPTAPALIARSAGMRTFGHRAGVMWFEMVCRIIQQLPGRAERPEVLGAQVGAHQKLGPFVAEHAVLAAEVSAYTDAHALRRCCHDPGS